LRSRKESPNQNADQEQNHLGVTAGGEKLSNELAVQMVIAEYAEKVVNGLGEELNRVAGQAAAQKTAGKPTEAVPRSGAPLAGQHESGNRKAKLIPGAVNPGGERDEEDAAKEATPIWATILEPEPNEDECEKNDDGDDVRTAKKKATDKTRDKNSDGEQRSHPGFGPAEPGKDDRAEKEHKSDNRDKD
jgi:hypothetical protein